MTQSRDGTKTNRYPGEVRAGELAAVREAVATWAGGGDALVLTGDFNTGVKHSIA